VGVAKDMKDFQCVLVPLTLWVLLPTALLAGQTGEILTEAEADLLREEQEPARRIEVYLNLTQARLDRFETFRQKPAHPQYDYGGYLEELLVEYIGVNEELKNWIEYQHARGGDMRQGLRALLERGAQQLATLWRIQQSPDEYASDYEQSLKDALDQLTDLLEGGTRALAEQVKKLGELKQQEKEVERLAKQRAKEEAKRAKEERKLRKREGKTRVPAQEDE